MTMLKLGQWQMLSGCAWGLQPQAVALEVTVRGFDPAVSLAALDAVMFEFAQEALPADISATSDAQGLLRRLAFWSASIMRKRRIPVIAESRSWLLAEEAKGQRFRLAVCSHFDSSRATQMTLEWVARAISRHLKREPIRGFDELWEQLGAFAAPGINRNFMLQRALAVGYPVLQTLKIGNAPTFSIGTGRHARLFESTLTEFTSNMGARWARNKMLTAALLAQAGLPGAVHLRVSDAREAVAAATKIGYPVVVKPADSDGGNGVAAGLQSPQEVVAAFNAARRYSELVLVERHFEGLDHRITVCKGHLIDINRRRPGGVTGDGKYTIAALVEQNQAESQKTRRLGSMGKVELDDEALVMLGRQRLTPDDVPAAGQFVALRRIANLSQGGTNQPVPFDRVHPDNLRLAHDAAMVVPLDLAGVDLIIPDISVSWRESGALICEINGTPQLGPGLDGRNHDRVLELYFSDGVRVPFVVAVVPEDFDPARLPTLAAERGLNAWSSSLGLWIDGHAHTGKFAGAFRAAQAGLRHRSVHGLLAVFSARELIDHGIPVNYLTGLEFFDSPAKDHAWPATEQQIRAMFDPHLEDGCTNDIDGSVDGNGTISARERMANV